MHKFVIFTESLEKISSCMSQKHTTITRKKSIWEISKKKHVILGNEEIFKDEDYRTAYDLLQQDP